FLPFYLAKHYYITEIKRGLESIRHISCFRSVNLSIVNATAELLGVAPLTDVENKKRNQINVYGSILCIAVCDDIDAKESYGIGVKRLYPENDTNHGY
ncbi:hypothetical protein CU098_005050, partial [Rhizopus stolonifer]